VASSAVAPHTVAPPLTRLLPLVLLVFLGCLTIGVPLAVLPGLVHQTLGFGGFWVGVVMGAQSIATLATRGVAGSLCDRRGPRPAALLGLTACSLAGAAYMVAAALPNPNAALATLLAGRLLLGPGEGLLVTAALTWGVARVGAPHAGRVMSWVGIALYGAMAAGAPVGVVLQEAGFGAVALAAALLPLAGLAIALASDAPPFAVAGPRLAFIAVVRLILRPGIGLALASVAFAGMAAFLPLLFAQRGWPHAGLALTAFGVAYIVARLLFGGMPDRIGGRGVALISLATEVVGQLLLWTASSADVAIGAAAITGFGFSLVFPGLGTLAVRRVPPQSRGTAIGAYVAFFDLALGVTGPLAGLLAARAGYPAIFLGAAWAAGLGFAITARPSD
jgi:MFS family permease